MTFKYTFNIHLINIYTHLYQITDFNIQQIIREMRIAVQYLSPIDIPLYFAICNNQIDIKHIISSKNYGNPVSNEFDEKELTKYTKYKKKMDDKYGHSQYKIP